MSVAASALLGLDGIGWCNRELDAGVAVLGGGDSEIESWTLDAGREKEGR